MKMRKSKPRYLEIKEALYKQIVSNRWPPGYMIPTEHQLAEKYGVSRMTARHAVKQLESDGLLARVQGSGTFVKEGKKYQVQAKLVSLSEILRSEGREQKTLNLGSSIEPAGAELAPILKIEPNDQVLRIKQLRLVDGEPYSIFNLHIIYSRCEGLKAEDLIGNDFFKYMESQYGIVFKGVEQEITAVAASAEEAELLKVEPGFPLLRQTRLAYDIEQNPVNFSVMTFRGDKYSYRTTLQR